MSELKLVTYNIDGLPEQVDLKDLPCIFRPIACIYKMIKGSTIINVNDGNNHVKDISKYISNTNADIVGVQEDFNYHDDLISELKGYSDTTYTGGITLKNLFSNTEWLSYFPFPRFKTDGLNMLYKTNRIKVNKEDIVSWKKSAGYFCHANDKLTHKGFRYYSITVDNKYDIDVFIVHFDADFYDPYRCPNIRKDIIARESQYKQLIEYMIDNTSTRPIIVMGDTNSLDPWPMITEAKSDNSNDVDRVFILNDDKCPYKLRIKESYSDNVHLSDHKPLIVTLKIEDKNGRQES